MKDRTETLQKDFFLKQYKCKRDLILYFAPENVKAYHRNHFELLHMHVRKCAQSVSKRIRDLKYVSLFFTSSFRNIFHCHKCLLSCRNAYNPLFGTDFNQKVNALVFFSENL
jgi:hypothetical protein